MDKIVIQFLKKFLLLFTLFLAIIYSIDNIIKRSSKTLVSKVTISNIVQNSGNIQEFLNVYVNNSKVFNDYKFKQLNSNSYIFNIYASTSEELNDKIQNLKKEVRKISKQIVKEINDLNVLNTKYKEKKSINHPLDLFIIEKNPDFIKIKTEQIRPNQNNKDENLLIKLLYFIFLSIFMSISTLFFLKNFKPQKLKKFINILN
tara:strand:- start:653 stop:1261 length:609 start_codon:yes stop_codon:yes gene_type:complete